jgi:hypothetical protein
MFVLDRMMAKFSKSRRQRMLRILAGVMPLVLCQPAHPFDGPSEQAPHETWVCNYIANGLASPIQITSTFEPVGNELREIETIPKGLGFGERYQVLQNDADTSLP